MLSVPGPRTALASGVRDRDPARDKGEPVLGRRSRLLALVIAAVLVAAACGGGDDGEEEAEDERPAAEDLQTEVDRESRFAGLESFCEPEDEASEEEPEDVDTGITAEEVVVSH